ncbi:MAG: cupredoxin domain-containing protein [Microthrixaceae bacterium]|nr:cupredoxin domain-containing protein [Microthrixaceae bacterium]
MSEGDGDGGVDPDVEHEVWRQLLFWAGLAALVAAVAVLVVHTRLLVVPAVASLALLAGLVLLVRPGPVGPVVLGVAAPLLVVADAPALVDDLAHPDTFATFFPAAVAVVAGIVGAVGLVGFLRRWPVRAAGLTGVLSAAVVLVALAVGLVATVGAGSDVPRQGDLAVTVADGAWVPDRLTALASGDVAVYVTNDDLRRHTFTIDELGVDLEVPAGVSRRVAFTARPGTYELRSTVRADDLTGTLVVP